MTSWSTSLIALLHGRPSTRWQSLGCRKRKIAGLNLTGDYGYMHWLRSLVCSIPLSFAFVVHLLQVKIVFTGFVQSKFTRSEGVSLGNFITSGISDCQIQLYNINILGFFCRYSRSLSIREPNKDVGRRRLDHFENISQAPQDVSSPAIFNLLFAFIPKCSKPLRIVPSDSIRKYSWLLAPLCKAFAKTTLGQLVTSDSLSSLCFTL